MSNVEIYRATVYRQHRSIVVRKYFDLYSWFWHWSEFWLPYDKRRPYTYIMRDLFFPHMAWFLAGSFAVLAGVLAWLHWQPYPAAVVGILLALLWAHLRWGSKWIPGELV